MHACHCSTKEGLQDKEDGRVTESIPRLQTIPRPNCIADSQVSLRNDGKSLVSLRNKKYIKIPLGSSITS